MQQTFEDSPSSSTGLECNSIIGRVRTPENALWPPFPCRPLTPISKTLETTLKTTYSMTSNSDANAEVNNTMTTTARQLQLQHLRILADGPRL